MDIFARHGKRLKRITEPGQHVLKSIDIIMREVGNLRALASSSARKTAAPVSIATTHTQARYVPPRARGRLREAYPEGGHRACTRPRRTKWPA